VDVVVVEDKRKIFSIFVLSILVLALVHVLTTTQKETFEQRRTIVLDEISLAIEDAENQEKYKCCIEPPCTMCYLGDWIWDDGTCDCDGMIKNDEWESVCPQCIKGIKEGNCNSEKLNTTCPVI